MNNTSLCHKTVGIFNGETTSEENMIKDFKTLDLPKEKLEEVIKVAKKYV